MTNLVKDTESSKVTDPTQMKHSMTSIRTHSHSHSQIIVHPWMEWDLPRWVHGGSSQSELRGRLWKVKEGTVGVPMELCKVWDASAERWRVGSGGMYVWPVEASCVLANGAERWVLDELPPELSQQAYNHVAEGTSGGW